MVKEFKRELKTIRGKIVLFISVCIISAAGWVITEKGSAANQNDLRVREIVLEIQDMTFGDNNPTILLQQNESVIFTIINLDRGMKHNFAIPGTYVNTPLLEYNQKVSVHFQANEVGEKIYQCNPHASMMNGRLIIQKSL